MTDTKKMLLEVIEIDYTNFNKDLKYKVKQQVNILIDCLNELKFFYIVKEGNNIKVYSNLDYAFYYEALLVVEQLHKHYLNVTEKQFEFDIIEAFFMMLNRVSIFNKNIFSADLAIALDYSVSINLINYGVNQDKIFIYSHYKNDDYAEKILAVIEAFKANKDLELDLKMVFSEIIEEEKVFKDRLPDYKLPLVNLTKHDFYCLNYYRYSEESKGFLTYVAVDNCLNIFITNNDLREFINGNKLGRITVSDVVEKLLTSIELKSIAGKMFDYNKLSVLQSDLLSMEHQDYLLQSGSIGANISNNLLN